MTTNNPIESINYLSPTNIEVVLPDGTTKKFYAIRVARFMKLKELAKPVSSAISALFHDRTADNARLYKSWNAADGDKGTETVIQPISADLAKLRAEQVSTALDKLISSFMDEKQGPVFCMLFLDSMRDDFDAKDITQANGQKMFDTMDIMVMKAMLLGLVEANKGVFGPFADRVSEALNKKKSEGTDRKDDGDSDDSAASEDSDTKKKPTLVTT